MKLDQIKKLLKKAILAPFFLLMGADGDGAAEPTLGERLMAFAGNNSEFIPKSDVFREEENNEGQDAAASEDEAEGADLQGNQGEDADDGLDTASDEEGAGADQGEEGDADETTEKDEEGKGTKKKTFEERMAEIEAKLQAKLETELAERLKKSEPEKPDFVEVDMAAVNDYLQTTEDKIESLKLEGNHFEAKKLQREMDKLLSEIEANDAKKAAWQAKQQQGQEQGKQEEQARKSLEKTAELYREQLKIDPEVFDRLGKFFAAKVATDELLQREFNDTYRLHGEVAAIRFAHKYAVDNMGLEAKSAIEKKETNKNKAAAASPVPSGKVATVDLKQIKAEFDENPTPENFARYQEAKRKAK